MLKIINNERAFTLIELILSIAILSIIVIPISNMFLVAAKTNIMSKDKIIGVNLAQKAIEAGRENIEYDQESKYSIDTNINYANKYEIIENQTNQDSDYSAIITIDENSNEVKTYSINGSSRSLQWTTTNREIELTVTNTQIKNNEMIISNLMEPTWIRIEIYDQNENDILTKEFKIENETENELVVHIVKMVKDDSSNDNKVNIKIVNGRVKIVDGLYCKISNDNSINRENNQNRLLDIKAKVTKDTETITELETIKKIR